MKFRIKNLFFLFALIACVSLLLINRAAAQTFTTLHSFTGSDGDSPYSALVLAGGNLYGTATLGGNPGIYDGAGTLFVVNTGGTTFSNVYLFSADSSPYTNGDGATPYGALVLSGSTLFGVAYDGGTTGVGTIFAINTNQTGFTNLHNFTQATNDGGYPDAGMILSGSTLFGTAALGGTANYGVVFALNTNGNGYTNLYSFTNGSDSAGPAGVLLLVSNVLYGTASGGNGGEGSVFSLNTNGTGFKVLHSFTENSGNPNYTNSDGYQPEAGLILSGPTLYGTASSGGPLGHGVLFSVQTNGSNYTVLYNFTGGTDGANPRGGLVLSGTNLYGTTYNGAAGSGTIFSVNTNGSNFLTLHTFSAAGTAPYTNSDGAHPEATLILSGNTLYGTATGGGIPPPGDTGQGTVFSLSLGPVVSSPRLNITLSGTNVILTWATNATGFTLEATTNLVPPVTWSNLSGQFTVTNPVSSTKKFYQLSQ